MNTSRPWTAEMHGYADGHKELHVCSGPDTLAVMRGEDEPGDGLSETVRADARLMATAPELLAACECAVAALNQHKTYPADCALAVKVLSAAIVKAKEYKMDNYVGAVVDRLTGKTVYRSRPVAWEQAQRRAERHAKGDRYLVVLYPSSAERK